MVPLVKVIFIAEFGIPLAIELFVITTANAPAGIGVMLGNVSDELLSLIVQPDTLTGHPPLLNNSTQSAEADPIGDTSLMTIFPGVGVFVGVIVVVGVFVG